MCHHFEYERIDDLDETDHEELVDSHTREELEEEFSEAELETLGVTA